MAQGSLTLESPARGARRADPAQHRVSRCGSVLDTLPLSAATRNRHRDLLSAMFKRAVRLGLMPTNPVKGIPKMKEPGGRIVYLPQVSADRPACEDTALVEALPEQLRPAFVVSVHTGLRWSEQTRLE